MTDKEVMQMALDWFHWFQHGTNPNGAHVLEVEEAIRTRLAQPEKEWVGLTDEEVKILTTQNRTDFSRPPYEEFYRAIEAKLKEKNT
jgi:hypothetical protein